MAARARFLNGGPELHLGQALHRRRARSPTSSSAGSSAAVEAHRGRRPLDDGTALGPLARADLRRRPRRPGARVGRRRAPRLLTGGHRLDGPATTTRRRSSPTSTPDMPVFAEETFGPVAAVIRARDEDARRRARQRHRRSASAPASGRATPSAASASAARIHSGALFVNAHCRLRPPAALRRHQAQRLRPRARRRRDPRVRQRPDLLVRSDACR